MSLKPEINRIKKRIDKLGAVMYFDVNDFTKPLVMNETSEMAQYDMLTFVEQNPKYINKDLACVIIGINYTDDKFKHIYIDMSYHKVTKDIILTSANDLGNTVRYKPEYIKKYGVHTSDFVKIHKALMKDKYLSGQLELITIEDIYETLGKTPKKVKTSSEDVYSVAFDSMIEKTKKKLAKNGRYRFYIPYNFDSPVVSADTKDKAKTEILKYIKKHKLTCRHGLFFVDIQFDEDKNEITINCNEYTSTDKLKETELGTKVIFDEEYLIRYGFRFIDIERIYFALIKHPELSKKKSVSIVEISSKIKTWIRNIVQFWHIC